jgi:hypothetical protein
MKRSWGGEAMLVVLTIGLAADLAASRVRSPRKAPAMARVARSPLLHDTHAEDWEAYTRPAETWAEVMAFSAAP